jgi:Zn-dependent M16 (insulinase) family peptidase
MSAAVHRGDPIGLLDLDTALRELRQEIKDPRFIKQLVSELLLDNPHRVKVVMKPDRELASRLIGEEQTKLEALRTSLSDTDQSNVIELAKALNKRQSQEEDLSVLPQVTRADIPASKVFPVLAGRELKSRALEAQAANGIRLTTASAGTNGITYHQIVSPLPKLTTPLLALLPVYSQVVTEVGSADRDYLETQQAQHSITGGITAFSSFRSSLGDCEEGLGYLTLSSRTLNPKAVEMARLVKETVNEPRFDEVDRIRELVQQLSIRRANSVASNGHQYAMSAATASLRPLANISDFLTGVPAIMRLKKLASDIDDGQVLQGLAASMQQLHDQLRGNSPELLVITESEFLESYTEAMYELWGGTAQTEESLFDVTSIDNPGDRAFVVTTQVNYCATAYPTIPESNEDAAALSVLAGVLRNNFLHSEVREKGGAYGGGAGHDSTNGVFRFYSYRDPRLMETFEAFSQSIDWALNNDITDAMLEEAVLGIISSVDAPGSPAGEIRQAFHHGLFGRSAEYREASRGRYLDVRQDDLRRVIDTYLHKTPSRAVITSENRLGEVDNQFEQIFVNE